MVVFGGGLGGGFWWWWGVMQLQREWLWRGQGARLTCGSLLWEPLQWEPLVGAR